MLDWEWETFEGICNRGELQVVNPGPLHHPIQTVSIERDSKLGLRIITQASEAATGRGNPQHPLGTVSIVTESASFANRFGLEVKAEGLQIEKTTRVESASEPGKTTQQSFAANLKGSFINVGGTTSYVIDWLGNLDPGFRWPDTTIDRVEKNRTREMGDSNPRLNIINQPTLLENLYRNCARLSIGGQSLFLYTVLDGINLKSIKAGCLLYLGDPPDEVRKRIRECVHFMLGLFPVSLGHSEFDDEWRLRNFEAVSAYSMNGRAFELPPMPPSPLGHQWLRGIDRVFLSKAADALYRSYDDLNFGIVSWAYWHAVAAAPHIAGVHYGAAIESLLRAYRKSRGSKIRTKLISKEAWRILNRELSDAVNKANLSSNIQQIFQNKLDGLNQVSHSKEVSTLLTKLGLNIGKTEEKANRIRNVSAHGKDDNVDVEWIREVKVLRVHLHRLLLAMSGASKQYYDYSTLEHPVRDISEAIP